MALFKLVISVKWNILENQTEKWEVKNEEAAGLNTDPQRS